MQKGKRVRVLETIRQGKIGGGETHLLDLVEHLDKNIFEPVVLSFTDGPMIDRLKDFGIRSHIIPTNKPFDVTKWGKVKTLLEKEEIALVHAHGTRANSNVSWAAKKLGLPVVYTIHGWSFHSDQHPIVRNLRILGEKYLTQLSTINICVSRSNQTTALETFKEFNSVVIPNGINQQKFNPDQPFSDIRQELDIPADKILVLFLARFTHQKQPLAMIRAFADVVRQQDGFKLLMVGDGELKPQAEELIRELKLENNILTLPFRQDVPAILAAADIYVLPSLWEGLPIGLLEAMSMGKVVIASKVDGTMEVLRDRQNGLLVDVEQLEKNIATAILETGNNQPLRTELGLQARATIDQQFNVGKMTRNIEAIYKSLVL